MKTTELENLTLAALIELEPEIGNLIGDARFAGGFYASLDKRRKVFYADYKRRVEALVGFYSGVNRAEVLRSGRAYQIVYAAVVEAMKC